MNHISFTGKVMQFPVKQVEKNYKKPNVPVKIVTPDSLTTEKRMFIRNNDGSYSCLSVKPDIKVKSVVEFSGNNEFSLKNLKKQFKMFCLDNGLPGDKKSVEKFLYQILSRS